MRPAFEHAEDAADWLRQRVRGELQSDSRKLRPGDGFIAWPGAASDGRRHVPAALSAGASAVLVEAQGLEAFGFEQPEVAPVAGLKALSGPIASAFYRHPSAELALLAVTGTNGKTSCAWWLAQALNAAQLPCAVVGTLGMGHADAGGAMRWESTGLTTPDPVQLQAGLRRFADQGLRACAIEASSIGLQEARLNGCQLAVGIFTNLSRDHLDYHGSMAAYWAAKRRLFEHPGLRAAVVNLSQAEGRELATSLAAEGLDLWTVGWAEHSPRLALQAMELSDGGMCLTVRENGPQGECLAEGELCLPLVGRYNAENLICVLGGLRAMGLSLAQALSACTGLSAVPGRMESVRLPKPGAVQPWVLVDYAHTPDALAQALRALQPIAQHRGGRLWVLIGCGGDRDAGKRPLMAAAAEQAADRVVLTSDNPRSEDPHAILAQMRAGLLRPDAAQVLPDRATAIATAIAHAAPEDVLLIAGKGHETVQEIGAQKLPFNDRQHAEQALQRRGLEASL